MQEADRDEIVRAFKLITQGGLGEVRLPNAGRLRTISGYFSDAEAAADAAIQYGDEAAGTYVTLNVLDPQLIARSANVARTYAEKTTADHDITRRRWILIDVDPIRPTNTSSSDQQHDEAIEAARQIRRWLRREGVPEDAIVIGDSGNGGHVLVRIDMPNDVETTKLIERFLEAIGVRYTSETVGIDQSVFNASRISKLYGTVAAKGSHTVEYPHRVSRLVDVPEEVAPATCEQIRKIANYAPEPALPRQRGAGGAGEPFDIEDFIVRHNLDTRSPVSWKGDGSRKWVLNSCPWNAEHADRAAFIAQHASGAVVAGCLHNGCRGRDWFQLREMLEPGSDQRRREHKSRQVRRATERADAKATASGVGASIAITDQDDDDWGELGPNPTALPPVADIPPEMVPGSFRRWSVDTATRMSIPLAMHAIPALVSVSSIVGRCVGIRPHERDDWLVIANLWGAIVGRPGVLKSPAMRSATAPLKPLIAAAHEEFKLRQAEAKARKKQLERYRQNATHRLDHLIAEEKGTGKLSDEKRAAKQKREVEKLLEDVDTSAIDELPEQSEDTIESVTLELAELEREFARYEVAERRYLTNDSTTEKLGELMRENPRGLLLHRDELAGWLESLHKTGREGDREFFLEAWDGLNSHSVDRIGRGSIYIPALTLSVLGGVQPGKLSSYIEGAIGGGQGDDGLLQRLQMCVWFDEYPDYTPPESYPDAEARERVEAIFAAINDLDGLSLMRESDRPDGDDDRDPTWVPWVRFTEDAQPLWDEWRADLEARLRSDEFKNTPAFESWVAKLRSLAASLALIFHVIEFVDPNARHALTGVPADCLRLAFAWVEYVETHARRIYATELQPHLTAAAALAGKIEDRSLTDGMTVRDVQRARWSGLRRNTTVRAGLTELEQRNWVRIEKVASSDDLGRGRPSEVVHLHPALGGTS